jgi:hypothetical protein
MVKDGPGRPQELHCPEHACAEIADFLCRTEKEVRKKIAELEKLG